MRLVNPRCTYRVNYWEIFLIVYNIFINYKQAMIAQNVVTSRFNSVINARHIIILHFGC